MSSRRTLPEGRFERAAKLARMGAAAGLGLVTGRNTERIAREATAVLGSLRGMAAKVGQMASTVEGLLPSALDATFSNALARLRDQTDTSPYKDIASVVEAELGAPIASSYAEFDERPMASASIGQVHRARMHDGRLVAVKVQHPGIERAMENDLSNVRLIERLASSIVPKGFDANQAFDEVVARFREELDYRIEAANLSRFAELHRGLSEVYIPEVIESHSARRVLTTQMVDGLSFDQVLRDAPQISRHGYATTLFRFVFRSILVGGEFNADPHPGNYRFQEAPRVAFLDFGCVQRLSQPTLLATRALHRAAVDGDELAFARAVRELFGTRGGAFETMAVSFGRRAFAPMFDSPFRITSDYLRGLFSFVNETKLEVLRDRANATPYPPEMALLNRLQFGFYSLLARLDVEVDYAAIEREILAEPWPKP